MVVENATVGRSSVDDLRVDDRPAIASLLTQPGPAGADALVATVVDLAARGYLHIEQVSNGHCYRIAAEVAHDDLVPYERRVLELFRDGGAGGLVPFEQLTVGVDDEVPAWWGSSTRRCPPTPGRTDT